MIINFQVTDKLIDESKGSCPEGCVVANLLDTVINESYAPLVSSHLFLRDRSDLINSNTFLVHLPLEVARFIIAFDRYKQAMGGWEDINMHPRPALIFFQLDIPEQYLREEAVLAIKESGYKEAVSIVNECTVAALPQNTASHSEQVLCSI